MTLFKRNYAHVFSEQYFKMYRTVSRGNPNYFITYGNGKSAARVQNGLRPNGAHRWFNYYRAPKCGHASACQPACDSFAQRHPGSHLWEALTRIGKTTAAAADRCHKDRTFWDTAIPAQICA